jgi:hypothetical protein
MSIAADVARIAVTAAAVHAQGNSTTIIDGVRFNLAEKGYCARFVRLAHECALKIAPHTWAYAAANALQMEAALRRAGTAVVGDPRPGDVVAINRNSGANGHIGIVVGGGYFCENTSSTSRGPGTVKSALSLVASRISGYYRPYPSAEEQPMDGPLCIVLPGYDHAVPIELRGGVAWGPLRAFGEALHAQGWCKELDWSDHLADQGKLYVAGVD